MTRNKTVPPPPRAITRRPITIQKAKNWSVPGAARARISLGLSGTVDKESFDRLCDNLDPRTGEQLTVRTRAERTVGYDFTFSVPKSVSLLYARSGDSANPRSLPIVGR